MPRPLPRRSTGFTLIEIMVVMVIIGITLGFVMANIGFDDRKALQEETRRLALLMELARDQAITTGSSIAWAANGPEYGFWKRDGNKEWTQQITDEPLQQRTLAQPVTLSSLWVNRKQVKLTDYLVFSASGLSKPFEAVLAIEDSRMVVASDGAGRISVRPVQPDELLMDQGSSQNPDEETAPNEEKKPDSGKDG